MSESNTSVHGKIAINSLRANPTEWPNTLKQFVDNLPRNRLSVIDHFVGLTLKGITEINKLTHIEQILLQSRRKKDGDKYDNLWQFILQSCEVKTQFYISKNMALNPMSLHLVTILHKGFRFFHNMMEAQVKSGELRNCGCQGIFRTLSNI